MKKQAVKTRMSHASSAVPNAQTVAAMMEANDPAALKRYGSFCELREKV